MQPHTSAPHVFDDAITLQSLDANQFSARTTDPYMNMVGPFGGITAAVVLNAVLQHPERIGEPISMTVNYAAAIAPGEFVVEAIPIRTNRSTQHWTLLVRQGDSITTSATVFCGIRRDSWSEQELQAPVVPGPAELEPQPAGLNRVGWVNNYDFRFVRGNFNPLQPRPLEDSLTQLWIRDLPLRTLDFAALAALGDAFFPRVFTRRQTLVPAGTVSMTHYFHTSSARLTEVGTDYVLGQARATRAHNTYSEQSAHMWSGDGELLLSSTQMAYYKE